MPLLDTPTLLQQSGHDCGATAFAILFRYHYPRKPLPDWGELADPVRGLGADALELFARKEFPSVVAGHLDLPLLRQLTQRTPVLCVITVGKGLDHWVAVRGVTAHRVHVQDPATGRASYRHDEWSNIWCDSTAGGVWYRYGIAGWK